MDAIIVGLALGGNLGNVQHTLKAAQAAIESLDQVRKVRHSPIYRTVPLSSILQPDYLNAATLLETTLSPWSLLILLQQIELHLGKTPKPKEAPRPIDIDIIFYGQLRTDHPLLQLPHPHWHKRLFVVAPLSDLISTVPDLQAPFNLAQLRQSLAAQSPGVVKLDASTSSKPLKFGTPSAT